MGGAALAQPFLQAAVEHPDIAMAERQEHPPRPRRGDPAAGIIGDDGVGIGNAEGCNIARELIGARKHMRSRIPVIGDGVDVEEHRARQMHGPVIVHGQRQHAGQFGGRINDPDPGIIDMGGEPIGGDKRIVGGGCHWFISSQRSSWPGSSRPSTSYCRNTVKTWMPGTSPGMTENSDKRALNPSASSARPSRPGRRRRARRRSRRPYGRPASGPCPARSSPPGPSACHRRNER